MRMTQQWLSCVVTYGLCEFIPYMEWAERVVVTLGCVSLKNI